MAATVPLGRFGTPADIAGICLFLASPLAAYVSGSNLVAHGGGERPAFLAAAEEASGPVPEPADGPAAGGRTAAASDTGSAQVRVRPGRWMGHRAGR